VQKLAREGALRRRAEAQFRGEEAVIGGAQSVRVPFRDPDWI